jgi:hypothetical protein
MRSPLPKPLAVLALCCVLQDQRQTSPLLDGMFGYKPPDLPDHLLNVSVLYGLTVSGVVPYASKPCDS